MTDHDSYLPITESLVRTLIQVHGVGIPAANIPALIGTIYRAVAATGSGAAAEPVVDPHLKRTAAQVKNSITPDALISFEDGKSYKSLKRHLSVRGLTPEAYRTKWGLPHDYPLTAASYSAQRSALAHKIGLGKK